MNDRDLYIKAAIGDEAQEFFNSDIGQYVIQKSLQEVADNQKRFAECSVDKLKDIAIEIHANINIARKALIWMDAAIEEAKKALAILEVEEESTPE